MTVELRVTPAEGVTDRYAQASGDENPIHTDEAFARSVGLPGRILHGLWMAAQVARAAESVAPAGVILDEGGEPRYALESLSVQFRGMGAIGPDLVVSGTASEPREGTVELRLSVHQGDTRLIRNAQARVRVPREA
jgi:acyl dehydratase